jgi:hypothetical protein
MNPNSKDGFQLLPQQVDHTVTNAQLVDNDDDEVVVVTATVTQNHSSERQLFRSKCRPDDIPDVARDVTWYDSFYENDVDVIAAFDINHEMLDRNSALLLRLNYRIAAISILLIPLVGIGLFVLMVISIIIHEERMQIYRRQRTHVAIARQGIYHDLVDEPGSQVLMSRTVTSYDQIEKCMVHVAEGCWYIKYTVVVDSKSSGSFLFPVPGETVFKVDGLVGTQKFVDIVKAMMERSHCLNGSTNSEVQNNVETCESERTCNHEEEIFVAVAKLV